MEYVVDAEMREEEEVDQNQFDLSMMSAVEAHKTVIFLSHLALELSC